MKRAIITGLSAALPLLALGWALEVFRAVGLALFAEQVLMAMLALTLPLAFLTLSVRGGQRDADAPVPFYDIAAALLGFAAAGYAAVHYGRIFETLFARPVDATIAGGILIVLVIEALRRATGNFLAIIVGLFLLYALVGHLVPGDLQGRRVALDRLTIYLSMDSNGMLGMPLMVTATVVIMFVLFGSYLTAAGGGQFFTDLAMASMGRYRGGSAKIAVVASALFGSISGSAVANVASTGVITIPLMKRAGFRSRIAGGVEAVASTGGQLMPPVMGAAAFLMAELLQIGYDQVMLAALVPALIYFFAVFVQVDLIAVRDGIAAIPEENIPNGRSVFRRGWYFLIPFAVLIAALFWWNLRPGEAAFWSMMSLFPLGFLLRYEGQGLTLGIVWESLCASGRVVVDIILIGAAAGIIIGVLNITSLGFALTLSLIDFAGGSLILLLIMSAVLSVILGMGMPTVGVYILLATLIAPSLIEMGIEPIAAHLFVMYFGMMSMVTPPVAIAAFTASVIAKAPPVGTAVSAVALAWTAFIVPFVFVFEPAILLSGSLGDIIVDIGRLVVGVWIVSGSLVGQLLGPLKGVKRVLFGLIGVLALLPEPALPGNDAVAWATLGLALLCVAIDAVFSRGRKVSGSRKQA
ncbi:MAG: TRAP transporter fused permease subunit [Rhodobacteraceae bacterium]|nr:MAG: TRAP transporter fused permease subunit [Paracoccaceae bacterium]